MSQKFLEKRVSTMIKKITGALTSNYFVSHSFVSIAYSNSNRTTQKFLHQDWWLLLQETLKNKLKDKKKSTFLEVREPI